MSDERSYKNDEVRAIIDRALAEQPQEGITHDDLLAVGAEVGLSRTAMERAAREVQAASSVEEAKASVVSGRRRGLAIHAGVFAVLNAFLFAINYLTTPGEWWVLFSLFGWGLGLALHTVFGLSTSVSPRRLKRAQRRLQLQRAEEHSALADPSSRLRVSAPREELEASDPEPARDERTL